MDKNGRFNDEKWIKDRAEIPRLHAQDVWKAEPSSSRRHVVNVPSMSGVVVVGFDFVVVVVAGLKVGP